MPKHNASEQTVRNIPIAILTGLSIFAFIFIALFINPFLFIGLVTLVSIAAIMEVYYCFRVSKIVLGLPPLIIGSLGIFFATFSYRQVGLVCVYILTLAATIFYCSLDHIDYKKKIQQVTYSVFVCTWIPFLISFFVLIYLLPSGSYKVALTIIIVSFTDLGGLVIGSAFGKHKLSPNLSPGKTWEGFLGGILFAFGIGVAGSAVFQEYVPICNFFIDTLNLIAGSPVLQNIDSGFQIVFLAGSIYELDTLGRLLIFCIAAAVFGLIGDLTQSAVKRSLNIKDMGSFLPGHGGIMDRIDSSLVSAPILFLLLQVLQ